MNVGIVQGKYFELLLKVVMFGGVEIEEYAHAEGNR
jgi:hypothetical protein